MSEVVRLDSMICRIEWLASAGVLLTADRSQTAEEWIGAAPGVQAIFESIEVMAADLYRRVEMIEREKRLAAA